MTEENETNPVDVIDAKIKEKEAELEALRDERIAAATANVDYKIGDICTTKNGSVAIVQRVGTTEEGDPRVELLLLKGGHGRQGWRGEEAGDSFVTNGDGDPTACITDNNVEALEAFAGLVVTEKVWSLDELDALVD